MHTVSIAVFSIIAIGTFLIKAPKMKIPLKGIPMAANSHWLFGHSHILLGDFKEAFSMIAYDCANEDGLCGFWDLTNSPAISVNSAEKARMILATSSTKPGLGCMRRHTVPLLGKTGLPFLNGKLWKHQRSLYGKGLSTNALKLMSYHIRNITQSLTCALSDKIVNEHEGKPMEMNMEKLFQLVLADIGGKLFFGMDCKCCENLKQSPITESINFLVSEISRRISSPFNPAAQIYSLPTPQNRKYEENVKFIRGTLKDIIQERQKILLDSTSPKASINHLDFITCLLQGNESSDEKSIDEVIDSVCTAYMASFDSSTSTLQSILYCIASHAEVEEKCIEEMNKASLKDGSIDLDPERLVYCNAVVMESLRLFPAFVAMYRKLEKPLKFENVTIPSGTNVVIPFWHIQRDERHFPRALEFLPERWVSRDQNGSWVSRDSKAGLEFRSSLSTTVPFDDLDKEKMDVFECNGVDSDSQDIPVGNKSAFLSFSAGGRSCVGYKLAQMQVVNIVVELLRNFKFELTPGFKIKPQVTALSQKHFGGVPMIISKRN